MQQPEKAMLVVSWASGEMEFIPLQFNPGKLALERSNLIAEIGIPGLDAPLLQFVRGQNEKLNLELFFDTTEDGMGEGAISVTRHTDRIYELTKIEPERHAPPTCHFLWNDEFPGNDVSAHVGNQKRNSFWCIVESVKQEFTLFSSQGVPLRATLNVTLREFKPLEKQLAELNLSSPDRTRAHVVVSGDRLSAIAADHYERAGEWRRIADANGIEDPRRLRPGTILHMPPVP